MSMYAGYYNQARTHLALRKDAPVSRSIERLGRIIAQPGAASSLRTNLIFGRHSQAKGAHHV
jgi:hypothetical protein